MRKAPSKPTRRPAIPMRSVAFAVASALAGTAWANPTGPSVAAGSATFSGSGNTLNITNTPGTIINWQQFSIRPDEVTRFIQSGAMSAVLNRVVTAEQSQILGQLLSNGRVFLINPNGVTVGAGARIDTAGFIASSLNISDADFLSGRMRFTAVNGAAGKVVNEGSINAGSGGSVYLIAPSVENHGVITAPNGDVLLAAGKSVEVVASASPHIRVEITAPAESEALNVGQVVGGRIGIYGGLVRNAGTLNATTAMVGENGNIILKSSGDVRLEGGVVKAAAVDGGAIRIEGDRVVQGAAIDASGASGGSVSIQADTVLQGARIDARGTSGQGGVIDVQSAGSLIQTSSAVLDASGTTAGGDVTVQGTGERRVFTSGTLRAAASEGAGGTVKVLGDDIVLSGAKIDASGTEGGGKVLVGGDFHGANPAVPNAQSVRVTAGTAIAADATTEGSGGDVVLWADGTTGFAGTITARGGSQAGDGGRVEISGKASVQITGMVDASAPNGAAGSLLIDPKNIVIAATAPSGTPAFELNDPNPGANENFGATYLVTGSHAVVTDPFDSPTVPLANAGATYVFDVDPLSPTFQQITSTIVGASGGDQIGSGGVTQLFGTTGFLVKSPQFSGGAGAFTYGRAGAFAASGGTVGAGNSLIGGSPTANVGAARVDQFVSGVRFALVNPDWENATGAVTFGDAGAGMPVGILSAANSIVGAAPGDQIGSGGLLSVGPTANEAVVIASPFWNGGTGAVHWVPMPPTAADVNGVIPPLVGATGVVGSGNSLVGGQPGDAIGSGGMTRLANGNLVIGSPDWGAGSGASTWMDGATGFITGAASAASVVSATNSLTGTQSGDFVGQVVTPLSNGNYVLLSPDAVNGGGAVTLVAGATGGGGQPIVNGSTQPIAPVSSANSLLGGGPGALADAFVQEIFDGASGVDNGYLVFAPSWGGDLGAVTFSRIGGAGAGPSGVIDSSNSLVGSTAGDRVGAGTVDLAVVPLSGGWYAVQSPGWNGGAGAITFVTATNAPARLQGPVGAGNSLLGNSAGDHIGTFGCDGLCSAITDMGTGSFLVASPRWTFGSTFSAAGAVTLVDPAGGAPTGPRSNGLGVVTAANSIHGTTTGDGVGGSALTFGGGVYALDADRFAISSPDWNNTTAGAAQAGALTFGAVSSWTPGAVSEANSLYGTHAGDRIGSDGLHAIASAAPGTFALASSRWNTDAGAVTFFDTAGLPLNQAVSGANSVVGEATGDVLGSNGVVDVGAGRALIMSPNWRGGLGAVTLVDADAAKAGALVATSANSFTGSAPGDLVGAYGVTLLPNGNFVVGSDANGANAYTFMTDARGGQTLDPVNSLIGTLPYGPLGFDLRVLSSGDYIVVNPGYDFGKGMIVFGSRDTGVAGSPNASNAWLGTVAGEQLGANVQLLAGNQFVFNAPGATKGAFTNAGRLFVANPAGLGGGGSFNGTVNFADPPADLTIAASQIVTILNTGTEVRLQASNDITVNAPIVATAGNTSGSGSLNMQAGRSILVNANIENTNIDVSNMSIVLQANDPSAVGARDAGLGQLIAAAGVSIKGAGDVRLEVLDGTAPGTAGGMVLGSVGGANVELFNSSINAPGFDANRSIVLQPGALVDATQRVALIADGDARFGVVGGAGATARAQTTMDVVSFGTLTGGSGTLVDARNVFAPAQLAAESIGTATNPFGVLADPGVGLDAIAATGGIHLLHTAGSVDVSTYLMDAPTGQDVSLGVAGGGVLGVQAWNVVNNNNVRLYTDGGNILLGLPATPVTVGATSLALDAGGGAVFSNGGITINAPLTVTSPMFVTGGTTNFGSTADLASLALTGAGTTLNIGPGPTNVGTLNWGASGVPENNTIAGAPTATVVVSGSAAISGAGTRTLNDATLVVNAGAIASYSAGTGAFLFGGTGGIDNSGTFLIANGNTFDSSTGLLHTFLNRAPGVVDKVGGTPTAMGTSGSAGVGLINQGVVNLTGGDLVLNVDSAHTGTFNVGTGHVLTLNGAQALQAGSSVTGPGALAVAAAASNLAVSGNVNVGGFDVSNGTVTISSAVATDAYNQTGGAVQGPGDLTVRQSFNRSAGVFGSSPFGNLAINQASGDIVFNTQSPTASLKLTAPTGVVDVTSAVNVSGTVEYAAGAGVTVTNTTDAASLNIAAGGGTAQLNGPVAVTGAADLSGANIDIAAIFSAGSLNAVAAGGTVALNVPVTVTGAADISGANVDFNGTFTAGSVRAVATTGVLGVNAPITAAGTAELDGATVNVLRDVSGASIRFASPAVTLDNVTLTGPIDASAASLSIPDGSAVTFAGGGSNVIRDLGLGGGGTALTLTGGTTTVTNNFAWQGGVGTNTIDGTGAIVLNGNSSIGGDGTHVLDGVQMTNNGMLMFGPTFGAGGPMVIDNGAVLTNNGTFDLQNDMPIYALAGTGTLRNVGTLVKNATPTGSTVLGGQTGTFVFDNDGLVQVNAGNLVILEPGTGGTQSGTFNMGSGGGLIFGNGTHVLNGVVSGGTLGVSGTATVTIAGTLNANLMDISGGALDIDGAANTGVYNQTGGVVGGTGNLVVGSGFSQTGGSFGNQFNVLSVTQASGDISGTGFGAVGQLSLAAPAGAVNITTPLSLAGAASFFGGTGINISAPVTASSVGMVTAGTASISNATVNATSGAITVSANQVQVAAGTSPAGLVGAGGLTIASLNDVVVQGGTAANATAELNAGTGPLAMSVQRDLKIYGGSGANASARVVGDPDAGSAAVPIKIGGGIVMEQGAGAGATARIESVSPNSIYVAFPNASTGGYTVNGLAVTSDNGSGFYAGGVPAILDQNLLISYGIPETIQFDSGVLVTALDRSTQPLDATVEEEKREFLEQLFGDIEDAPTCK